MFLLCRRYYKEEEELVLDVGLFVKVLEVLKIMNNVVYIYLYIYMYILLCYIWCMNFLSEVIVWLLCFIYLYLVIRLFVGKSKVDYDVMFEVNNDIEVCI